MASGCVDSVCAVINNVCTILEEDYSTIFLQQCKQGFPSGYLDLAQAYNVIQSSLQQGSLRLQTSDTEKAKANFLVGQELSKSFLLIQFQIDFNLGNFE